MKAPIKIFKFIKNDNIITMERIDDSVLIFLNEYKINKTELSHKLTQLKFKKFEHNIINQCLSFMLKDKNIYWLSGNELTFMDGYILMDYKDMVIKIYVDENTKNIIEYFHSQLNIIEIKYNNSIKLNEKITNTIHKIYESNIYSCPHGLLNDS